MKSDSDEPGFCTTDIMSTITGATKQGSFNSSTDAKKGKGASVDKAIAGPNTKSTAAPTVNAAKKGTGATNDMGKINALANDKRLSVSF